MDEVQTTASTDPNTVLLDVDAVSARLCLRPSTVTAKLKSGELPGFRLGGEWRVVEADLADYIRALKERAL
jgi:excisionase family DNA binding protein